MKHVKLPVYDDKSMETGEHLEVSVTILQALAKTSVIYKDHVKLVQGATPEQEFEIINNIIDGRKWDERILDATYRLKLVRLHEDGTVDTLVKQDNGEWGRPAITKKVKPIPGFSKYTMDSLGRVVKIVTESEVPVVKGRVDNVLLIDDEGKGRRMSVDHLFKQTFPELT